MTKLDFLLELHEKLKDLPQEDVEERLSFYIEMIEDRMEEGLSEEEAVAAVGSIEEIAAQIIADISPASKKAEAKPKRRLKAGEIVLLVLGSPILLSLLIAAFAVVLSLYASLWAVIISLWAVFGSLAGCALGCVVGGIFFSVFAITGHGYAGIVIIAGGLVCAGLAILMFYGCKAATVGSAKLTKWFFQKCFSKKEAA